MKFKIIVKILQANAYFSLKALFFFFKDKCLCLLVCFLGLYGSSVLLVSTMLCKEEKKYHIRSI